MKTKLLATVLTTTVMFASGVAVADTGTCGEGCAWSFDSSTGALTITGSGSTVMDDYVSATKAESGAGVQAPWISNMENITSVNISGVSHVSANAFDGATNLQTATIPEGVTSLGMRAFNGSGVQTVSLPTTLTTMGNAVFQNATSLTSVDIPDSVTSFGQGMFNKASSLTSVTLPSGLTEIPTGTFQGNSSLTTVDIPSTVTVIGNGAFNGATSLTDITIPAGVTSIGDGAFQDASSLEHINLPEGLTSLGSWAFNKASSLQEITIPSTVETIGSAAFQLNTALGNVIFATDENGNCSLITIDDFAFSGDYGITSIEIPDGVEKIGTAAFNSTSLGEIEIPNSVTSIGESAFNQAYAYTDLTDRIDTIVLSENLEQIGNKAFSRSTATSIILPESLFADGKELNPYAFEYMALETIYCPEGNEKCLNYVALVCLGEDLEVGCDGESQPLSLQPQINTYRQDANGNYIINGIRYSSYSDMVNNKNAHPMRRMYTVEEAERASRNTGNTIKLRYK